MTQPIDTVEITDPTDVPIEAPDAGARIMIVQTTPTAHLALGATKAADLASLTDVDTATTAVETAVLAEIADVQSAVTDLDNQVQTDFGNVATTLTYLNDRLSDAEADIAALPGQYAPLADRIWLPASAFITQSGAPSFPLVAARYQAIRLPDAATTAATASLVFPADWQSVRISMWWTTDVSGPAANARITLTLDAAAPGDSLNVSSVGGAAGLVAAAPTTAMNLVSTVAFSDRPITTTRVHGFRVIRLGSDGTDTLAGHVDILGFDIVRLS